MADTIGNGVAGGLAARVAESWLTSLAMTMRSPAPPFAELVRDLKRLRQDGIVQLRRLDLPAVALAARATGQVAAHVPVEPAAIEVMVRQALAGLGERLGGVGALLYGLEPGTRHHTPAELRRDAAERWGVSLSRFRHHYELLIIEELAESILRSAHEYQLRLARLDMERRTPVSSRLAVAWTQRFEAYYRLWTPISGVGNDLTAYRSSLLDPERPYDEPPDPDAGVEGLTQEEQALSYGINAFYHFVHYLWNLQGFIRRFGGLWLLSDAQAEQDVADAVYRLGWHSPFTASDNSYLRSWLDEVPNQELQPFLDHVRGQRFGLDIWQLWKDWLTTCGCAWSAGASTGRDHFPTARNQPGIAARCQVHAVVAACSDYLLLIDDDWQRVADWYHLPVEVVRGPSAAHLYEEHVRPTFEEASAAPPPQPLDVRAAEGEPPTYG